MNQPIGPHPSASTHSVRPSPATAAGRNLRAALADAERAIPPTAPTDAATQSAPEPRGGPILTLRPTLLNGRGRRWWTEVLLIAGLAAACLAMVGIVAKAAAAGRGPSDSTVIRIPAAPPVSRGIPLVTLPWGEGPGQVGISRPGEGLARAPEALAVAPDGRIAVLDSVNRRVVTLTPGGEVQTAFALPLRTPRFLAVDDEAIHVLDSDEDRQLLTFDWDGGARSSRSFNPEEGTVTGLFSRHGCAFVETEHSRVVSEDRVAGTAEAAADAAGPRNNSFAGVESPGRPIAGRSPVFAQARFARGERPHVRISDATGSPEGTVEVEFAPDADLEHLVSLDGDRSGEVILGARLARPRPTEDGVAALVVVRASTDGVGPVDALRLCDDSGIAETGQPYFVGPDGRIYQPKATPAGYMILVHTFPEGAAR